MKTTFHFNTARQFRKFLKSFATMTKRREAQFFTRIVNHAERSMRFGSLTTGAPGQPFKTGNLRDKSFTRLGSIASREVELGFDLSIAPYAPIIENRLNNINLRSSTGGFHSIKITHLNFILIMRQELAVVKAQIGIAR